MIILFLCRNLNRSLGLQKIIHIPIEKIVKCRQYVKSSLYCTEHDYDALLYECNFSSGHCKYAQSGMDQFFVHKMAHIRFKAYLLRPARILFTVACMRETSSFLQHMIKWF